MSCIALPSLGGCVCADKCQGFPLLWEKLTRYQPFGVLLSVCELWGPTVLPLSACAAQARG